MKKILIGLSLIISFSLYPCEQLNELREIRTKLKRHAIQVQAGPITSAQLQNILAYMLYARGVVKQSCDACKQVFKKRIYYFIGLIDVSARIYDE